MKGILYLRKANDDLVSHCRCAKTDALISSPIQMDCPWCGCGWLFICSRCHKAFTFAEAFESTETWEQIAKRAKPRFTPREPTANEVEEWIGFMKIFLKGAKLGQQYVYLDGWTISAAAEEVHIDGWHSRHDLYFVPQVAALSGECPEEEILCSRAYWHSTHVEDEEG